jgi:hypothetical protein
MLSHYHAVKVLLFRKKREERRGGLEEERVMKRKSMIKTNDK